MIPPTVIHPYIEAALAQLDEDLATAGDTAALRAAREAVAALPGPDRPWPPAAPAGTAFDGEAPAGLLALARLAEAVAPHLCHRDPETGETCAWYHGFWPFLRLLGLAATPHRHGGFYDDALGALAADGNHRRVMVTGTADFAMPSRIVAAYRAAGAPLALEVTDLCETPAFLCRWYGRLSGIELAARACDVLDCTTERPVDVICSHSFLSRFPAEGRQALAARWRDLLRPGGKVVSVTRINPEWRATDTGFGPEAVRAFGERVQAAAAARRGETGIDPAALAAGAAAYAGHQRNWSLTSVDELVELFTGAGFAVDRLDLNERPGQAPAGQAVPGINRTAVYAEFVVSRR